MSVFYRQRPGWRFPRAVRAEGVYIWDDEGHRLIDAAGGALVVGVGHGVREIAEAIGEQAQRLAYVHGGELTSEPVETLARELARRAPVDDAHLFLVSGGSEATETAIKPARQYQGLADLPAVGDVRGLGLMAAVEIVAEREGRRPYPPAERMAQRIQAEAIARGAIVYASGGQADGAGDLVMLGPPLTITNEQVDDAVTILGDAIAAATRR